MRYAFLGCCVIAAACAGEGSGVPTSPSSTVNGSALTEAKGGSRLPFKGTLQGPEAVEGTEHRIEATGNATHLGQFTLVSEFTVTDVPPPAPATGAGTATWTAANGDTLITSVTGVGVVQFPIVTITEAYSITGGTGRFVGASGTFTGERTFNILTGITSGPFTGTISLGH